MGLRHSRKQEVGQRQNFPPFHQSKQRETLPAARLGRGPLLSGYWGWAQLEAISPADSITSGQGHGEVLRPCQALRRVRRCCCKCAAGSELPQHLFPSRILIILHLSTLQGANGVIM